MPTRNWKKVNGPVTVKAYNGAVRVYDTLEDAVLNLGEIIVNDLQDDRLGASLVGALRERSEPFNAWDFYRHNVLGGSSHFIYDENGLVIPSWKVKEVYRNLPNEVRPGYCRFGFRRPRGRYFRRIATTAERRENEAITEAQEELLDYGVSVKVRGKRRNLPSNWDDITHARNGDNWKNYRKTQYKETGK